MTISLCGFLLAQRDGLSRSRSAQLDARRLRRRRARHADQGAAGPRDSRRGARALFARHARCRAVEAAACAAGPRRLLRAHRPVVRRSYRAPIRSSRASSSSTSTSSASSPSRTTAPASGGTSCRGSSSGIMPWISCGRSRCVRSWRDAPRADNGFSWERFCVVWAVLHLRVLQHVGLEAAVLHPAAVPGARARPGVRAHAPVVAGAHVDRPAARARRQRADRGVRAGVRRGYRRIGHRGHADRDLPRVRPVGARGARRLRRRRDRRVRVLPRRLRCRQDARASPRCRCRR